MKLRNLFLLLFACTAGSLTGRADIITVTNAADSGAGSLRAALAAASNGDTIEFDAALNGQSITLTSAELLIKQDITINGPGANQLAVRRSTTEGTPAFRVFDIAAVHIVTINGLTISNGLAQGAYPVNSGGGIYADGSTLVISNCTIADNNATSGAGIFCNSNNTGSSHLTVNRCVLTNNTAESGGGIYNLGVGNFIILASVSVDQTTISNNSAGTGAGIFNDGQYQGHATLTVVDSTISGNQASQLGGGIYNEADELSQDASVTLTNSTVSDNSAQFGGAIYNHGDNGRGTVQIASSTFNGNSCGASNSGTIHNTGWTSGSGVVSLRNTILKAGSAPNIYNSSGLITSLGYNLSSDNGSGFLYETGDQIDADPRLGPLQDNGGPTLTRELLAGSRALNAGDPNFTPPPKFDQRGSDYPRVRNGRIDIGSFESDLVAPTPAPTATPGGSGVIIVANVADNGPGSLRDALGSINDGERIQFDASLNGQSITLTSEELLITKDITIDGPGANELTIRRASDGAVPNFRIFEIVPGRTVTIQKLTISNGRVEGDFGESSGGGIMNRQGTLTITDCVISGNTGNGGGGIFNRGELNGHATLVINNSIITGNAGGMTGGGGILNDGARSGDVALVTVNNSTISGNSGWYGGGVYNSGYNLGTGILVVNNSAFSGNTAELDGAAIFSNGRFFSTETTVRLNNSTLSGNVANRWGGGVYNDATDGAALVAITNGTVSDNSGQQRAGGLFNHLGQLTVSHTLFKMGSAGANIYSDGSWVQSLGYNMSSDNGAGFLHALGDRINIDPMLGPLQNNGGPTVTHGLLEGSPAINAGDPSFHPPPEYDQRGPGFPRVVNGRIDIGALEYPTGPPELSTLLNISTRLQVLTGNHVLIGGLIVNGSTPKRVIVRALGPSLGVFGIPNPLSNPMLMLQGPEGFSAITNNNWKDMQENEIRATNVAPTDDLESAIVATLPAGAYTAVVSGNNDGIGVGLVDAYDLDSSADSAFANISTRGFVDSGNNVLIGGFILGNGNIYSRILIRGIGPSLAATGVPDTLLDPTLELHNGNGDTIGLNDDWRDTQQAEIEATGAPPTDLRESAMVQNLPAGAYTAVVAGKNDAIGVALVEVYQLENLRPTPALPLRQERR